ncbi:MAG: glycosyltransferase family 4 protein [Rhodothermales bacterium]|nr:glycosyltransferase family 4 protein [Rhodothermales bacterium]
MLRTGQTLISHDVFDEVVFLATYEYGLAKEETVGEKQRVVRLGTASRTMGKVRHLIGWMRKAYAQTVALRPACINVHSLTLLPLGVLLKFRTGAKLVYDTHELESRTAAASAFRKHVYGIAERQLMRFVDHTFVVCTSIEQWYRKAYGDIPITTVKNYPSLRQSEDAGMSLRERIDASPDDLVFLYQGRLGKGRGIEMLLEVFGSEMPPLATGSRHIVFMGEGPFAEHVCEASRASKSIHWIPPVQPSTVLAITQQADASVCVIEPISESYRLALPNKMLESLACEVPVIASDLPEMRAELKDGALGWLVDPTDSAVRATVCSLTKDEVHARRQALSGWFATHNWEAQETALTAPYRALLSV